MAFLPAHDYSFKFIVVGDTFVGKSCLLLQFTDKRFKTTHELTIGVEFGSKTIPIKGQNIKLQIWDTAGQESFRSITKGYYRGSIAALVVYDITNRTSFEDVTMWVQELKNSCHSQLAITLVGNKVDIEKDREVMFEEGASLATKMDLLFFETSAKTGHNIDDCFMKTTELIYSKLEKGEFDLSNESLGIKVGHDIKLVSDVEDKKGCCK